MGRILVGVLRKIHLITLNMTLQLSIIAIEYQVNQWWIREEPTSVVRTSSCYPGIFLLQTACK